MPLAPCVQDSRARCAIQTPGPGRKTVRPSRSSWTMTTCGQSGAVVAWSTPRLSGISSPATSARDPWLSFSFETQNGRGVRPETASGADNRIGPEWMPDEGETHRNGLLQSAMDEFVAGTRAVANLVGSVGG